MNKAFKHIMIGSAMSVMAIGAFAADATEATAPQNTQGRHAHVSPGDHHKRMDPAKFKEKMAQRQAELRQKLNLSAAQEPAWNAFVAAMTPPERSQRPDRAEWDKLTAPERMEKKLQRMQQREARMAKQLEAVKSFYAQLTPEQRSIFDEQTKRGRKHAHKRG